MLKKIYLLRRPSGGRSADIRSIVGAPSRKKKSTLISGASLLLLGILFGMSSITRADSSFGTAQYGKNELYNLRTTVGNGTAVYGSFTQSIMRRPSDKVKPEKSDQIPQNAQQMIENQIVTSPTAGVDPQPVSLQKISGDNYMLLNSNPTFEPSSSFGGLGYNLTTKVTNPGGETLYAINRLALLSNPFVAIFGNVFAGDCNKDLNNADVSECRKLSFGQRGVGVSNNNLGGANLQYQIPGYLIQSNSILSWDKGNNANPYGNETMEGIITDLQSNAFWKDCPNFGLNGLTLDSSNLSFDKLGTGSPCVKGNLTGNGNKVKNAVVYVNGDLNLSGANKFVNGSGTIIVQGNLKISKNLTYASQEGPIGFIVLGQKNPNGTPGTGGTVSIGSGVSQLQGMFYVPGSSGKISIETGNSALKMKGVFAATTFEMNKRTGNITGTGPDGENLSNIENSGIVNNDPNNPHQYNVAILYDPRIQTNPPPGFKYGISSSGSETRSLFEPAS